MVEKILSQWQGSCIKDFSKTISRWVKCSGIMKQANSRHPWYMTRTVSMRRARLFYADGQLAATGVYYNSVKDSTWCYYSYYDHSLTTRETYSKGKRNGPMINYYNNGNPSEKISWVNDKKDGPWEQYFANNMLKLKAMYKEGKLEGEFLVNYDSGKPYLKGGYKNDLREGKWIFFNEDGTTDMELAYHGGGHPRQGKTGCQAAGAFSHDRGKQGKI